MLYCCTLEKEKTKQQQQQHFEVSLFYTYVPEISMIWSTLPKM